MELVDLPPLVPSETARKATGLGRAIFYNSCASGELPLRLIRLGPRNLQYVRLAELRALLADQLEISRG